MIQLQKTSFGLMFNKILNYFKTFVRVLFIEECRIIVKIINTYLIKAQTFYCSIAQQKN